MNENGEGPHYPNNPSLEQLRERVAEEHKFAKYRPYTEKEAAGFIGIDYRTLQRWRLAERLNGIRKARRASKDDTTYMGYEIADLILGRHNLKLSPQEEHEAAE